MPINLNFIVDKNPIALLLQKIVQYSPVSTTLNSIYSKLFSNTNDRITNFYCYLGAAALSYISCKIFWNLFYTFGWMPGYAIHKSLMNSQQFKNKYGDCYVLITGCTDGIGEAFAQKFTKMGFNLFLVARNPNKLDILIRKLHQINPKSQLHGFIADLGKRQDIASLQNQIQNFKEQIGIVVNCAGVKQIGKFFQQDPDHFLSQTNINFYSMFAINHKIIPRLQKRQKKSAILNICSVIASYTPYCVGIYAPLKKMMDIYSKTLSYQNRNKIDIISCKPFGVSTKMIGYLQGPLVISPKECVQGTLLDLGRTDQTEGGFRHKFAGKILNNSSQKYRNKLFKATYKKIKKADN